MKKLKLIWLILFICLCAGGISAQTESKNEKEKVEQLPLYTEFIKLNYLNADRPYYENCFLNSEESEKLPSPQIIKLVKKLLSARGIVEIDSRSNSLIITDTKSQINLMLKKLKEWDKPDVNLNEVIKNFENPK